MKKVDRAKAPILEMLQEYADLNALRLHMPGHKGVIDKTSFDIADKLFGTVFKYDITELSFSDNLQSSKGAIKASEELFAMQFGVKYSHFLVNGSTVGIFAMVNICSCILVERAAHISVFNAIRALNKNVYVIDNEVIDGIPQPIKPEHIIKTVLSLKAQGNNIDAVLLCGVNYYGLRVDAESIYESLRSMGIKLFIDAAHGAHFGLSRFLPRSFENCSDAFVVSLHKTLPSLTQTAVLNVNSEEIDGELKSSLNVFTTSSPSYVLLASFDYARIALICAQAKYDILYKAYLKFKAETEKHRITILKNDDFSRLIISINGINGEKLYREMEGMKVFCEFFDEKRIGIILGLNDQPVVFDTLIEKLISAVRNLSHANMVDVAGEMQFAHIKSNVNNSESNVTKLESIFHKNVKTVKLTECIGKISAVDIFAFPPSIPIILKGERINKTQIETVFKSRALIPNMENDMVQVFED